MRTLSRLVLTLLVVSLAAVSALAQGNAKVETIPAPTRRRIIDGEIQIVAPQKPLECPLGFDTPAFVACTPIGFETRRDHRLCFHRLLIKSGSFSALSIKSVGANGNKLACCFALQVGQPT